MPDEPMPALRDLSGIEQIRHLSHPDHPAHAVAGATLVDFKEAADWHDRIHADALAENYDLGHQHR